MPNATENARHTVIVEPNPTGHRLFYVRLLIDAAVQAGDRVTLVLGPDPDPEAERLHLGGISSVTMLRREVSRVEDLVSISVSLSSDRIVLPDGDRIALRLALRRRWHGSGLIIVLVMRERAQPGGPVVLTAAKSLVRTAAFCRVAAMAGVRLLVLKSPTWTGRSRFAVALDPIRLSADPSAVADFRRSHAMTEDRYWFAVLGAVSARKNLPLILEALKSCRTPAGLLVAGQFDEDVPADARLRLLEASAAGNAIVIDRLLTDEELDAAVAAADCVVLAHSNEGPSGLLGKAAATGTRIVAAGAQSLREDLQANPSIGQWVPLTAEALSRALDQAATQQRPAAVLTADVRGFTSALLP